jgi:hypothetical protein
MHTLGADQHIHLACTNNALECTLPARTNTCTISQKNSPNTLFIALLLLCIFYIHQIRFFSSIFTIEFFIIHEIPSFCKNITHLLFLPFCARFHYFYTLHFLFSWRRFYAKIILNSYSKHLSYLLLSFLHPKYTNLYTQWPCFHYYWLSAFIYTPNAPFFTLFLYSLFLNIMDAIIFTQNLLKFWLFQIFAFFTFFRGQLFLQPYIPFLTFLFFLLRALFIRQIRVFCSLFYYTLQIFCEPRFTLFSHQIYTKNSRTIYAHNSATHT